MHMSFKANFDHNLIVQRSCHHACVGRFNLLVLSALCNSNGSMFLPFKNCKHISMLSALLELLAGIGSIFKHHDEVFLQRHLGSSHVVVTLKTL